MEDAAAEGGDAAVTTPPPPPTCPVCMEPWTCNGAHRICCIPCGHVYGRSCLERWLHRSGNSGAKCPQCGEQFERKLITNLYAPGNLWEGCCRLQKVKSHCQSEIHKIREDYARSHSRLDELREIVLKTSAVVADNNKKSAEFVDSIRAEMEFIRAVLKQKLGQIERMWSEEKATDKANLMTMKERMKKIAEEEKATAADLIEFMESSFPQLSMFSEKPHASVSAPALVDSQNNTRQRQNRPDQVPPVPAPPGPADAVKKRRRPDRPDQVPPVPAQPGPADAVKKRRRPNRPDQVPPVPAQPGPADAVKKRSCRGT